MNEPAREFHPTTPARLKALFSAFLVVSLLAMALGVVSVGYLALQANRESERNGELLQQVKQTNKRLIDCTAPEGTCYQEGQKRTGEAIVGINKGTLRVITAALSCQADGLTEERELALCTAERAQHP